MIPYTEENSAKIKQIAETILGTCHSLDTLIGEEFGEEVTMTDLDTRLLQELDDITQECQSCGWWCETSDLNDDQTCSDCAHEEDDDE